MQKEEIKSDYSMKNVQYKEKSKLNIFRLKFYTQREKASTT